MLDMKIVGENIRKRRKDAAKLQERFAEELGISVRSVSYIETGAVTPNLKTFVEIIKILNCKAEDIIIAQLCENLINYRIYENRKVNAEENIINDILHHFKWWFPFRFTLVVQPV